MISPIAPTTAAPNLAELEDAVHDEQRSSPGSHDGGDF